MTVPRGDARVWLGIDVGGTKVLAGAVDEGGRVLRTVRLSSRVPGAAELEDVLTEAVETLTADGPVAGVGLAAAGFVDASADVVAFAPHLPWRDDLVRPRLAARWGLPVALDNDATCAVWAEREHGALQGVDHALVVTVGTGIGGGLLLDGRVVRGAGGMAGEFGHARVVPDGRPCPCGLRGCWERYASGSALVEAAGQDFADGPAVTASAEAGDARALGAFESVGTWLGVGLANLVAAFDPRTVVVGGGVAEAGELLLAPARRALARHLVGAARRRVPDVVPSHHGELAGLVGAATLARHRALAG